jgi:hypothetical protein
VKNLAGTIPPGADYELEVDYLTGVPGEFEKEFPIYTDCPGYGVFLLKIKGRVVEAPSGASQ